MYLLANGDADALDDGVKLGLGHDIVRCLGHVLGRDGAHAVGRLEDGVVDLQAVLLAQLAFAPASLEARGDFIGPAFEPCVDGLEVDAGVAPAAASEFRSRGIRSRTRSTGTVVRLGDWRETRGRGGLDGEGGFGEEAIIGVVADLVSLGKTFVARRGESVARHSCSGRKITTAEEPWTPSVADAPMASGRFSCARSACKATKEGEGRELNATRLWRRRSRQPIGEPGATADQEKGLALAEAESLARVKVF